MRKRSAWSATFLLIGLLIVGCGAPAQTIKQPEPTKIAIVPTATATPDSTATAAAIPTAPVLPKVGQPARILIPRIGIDAPIEGIGTANGGNLATPTKNPWDGTGWYEYGVRPGEDGSAVIDGHVDRPGGSPAVFWYLKDLQNGDRVSIVDTNGKSFHFRVTRVASYPPTTAPVEEIFGKQGGNYLNLITCAGDWIASEHQTTLRLVVYTQMIA
jgi:LPXTG-site transpeptidase (sortase) family protein